MRVKRVIWAVLLSIALHILGPLIEMKAGFGRKSVIIADEIVSAPAHLCSMIVPPGHGVPQLVFPFFFSLAFYASLFWLLLTLYARRGGRDNLGGGKGAPVIPEG
jgi:hypothetical protein